MRALAGASRALAVLAAWALFCIGAMLTYEVVARYFFNAPTIWAEELSRLFLIWAVFASAAWLLAANGHIRVTVVVERLPRVLRRVASVTALLFVAIVSTFVAWHGLPIALQSLEVGRTTGSMLDIPQWWSQAAIPFGFALMALEAFALALGVLAGGPDPLEREPASQTLD